MCFAKRAVLSLRVLLSLYRAGLSLSIVTVGLFVLGLYVLTCITLHVVSLIHIVLLCLKEKQPWRKKTLPRISPKSS